MLPREERGSVGKKLFRTPENRKCEQVCGTQKRSQHFKSLLSRQCPGKVKLKTEVLGSWVCLELSEFPAFSRTGTASTAHPWGLPTPPVLQASPTDLTVPWDGAAAARVCRVLRGRARAVGARSQQQTPWGGCLGRDAANPRCAGLCLCPGHTPPMSFL